MQHVPCVEHAVCTLCVASLLCVALQQIIHVHGSCQCMLQGLKWSKPELVRQTFSEQQRQVPEPHSAL